MSLATLFRLSMAAANTAMESFTGSQESVTVEHYPWTGDDDAGQPTYTASPIPLRALVERATEVGDNATGDIITCRHHLVFPYPIEPWGTRLDPIDERDKFVLPGGITGPIVRVTGPLDPSTRRPYMSEVWLG